MKYERIFEIELSSLCNAKCNGCMRTLLDNKNLPYYKGNITFDEIVKWFKHIDLSKTKFKLCGVLGDPMVNPDIEDILDYLLFKKQINNIEISTNGGMKSKSFWSDIGIISKLSQKRMFIHWAIDGVTSNDYRENVNIGKVWENFDTYIENGGNVIWQYIEFDYNKHEIELAKKVAKEKNIPIVIRKSWRNNSEKAKFKSEAAKKIDNRTFEQLEKKIYIDNDYEENTISCRHKKQNEYFIGADRTLWPCCHLYDEYVSHKSNNINKVLNHYGKKFNDLNTRTIDDIINNVWFTNDLETSWNKNHPLHLKRCYLACGDNGKRSVIKKEI